MKEARQHQYEDRITADPKILGGKPVVRGTRIAVSLVLEELANNPDIKRFWPPILTSPGRMCRPAFPMPRRWSSVKKSPRSRPKERALMLRWYEVPV
jgi:hypothetical protein